MLRVRLFPHGAPFCKLITPGAKYTTQRQQ